MLVPSIGGFIVLAIWVFAIFDVIATDEVLVRNLPKGFWLIFVVFVPLIGSIAWLIMGRPLYASWQPGGQAAPRPPKRFVAPEDRPEFSSGPRGLPTTGEDSSSSPSVDDLRRWERELAQREDDLRRREVGGSSAPDSPDTDTDSTDTDSTDTDSTDN
jgi:Phospholipase_D-nuclease N-terminal